MRPSPTPKVRMQSKMQPPAHIVTPPQKHLRGKSLVSELLGRSHHEIPQAHCAISARVAVSLLFAGASRVPSSFQTIYGPAAKKSSKHFQVPVLQLDTKKTKINQTCCRTSHQPRSWDGRKPRCSSTPSSRPRAHHNVSTCTVLLPAMLTAQMREPWQQESREPWVVSEIVTKIVGRGRQSIKNQMYVYKYVYQFIYLSTYLSIYLSFFFILSYLIVSIYLIYLIYLI